MTQKRRPKYADLLKMIDEMKVIQEETSSLIRKKREAYRRFREVMREYEADDLSVADEVTDMCSELVVAIENELSRDNV